MIDRVLAIDPGNKESAYVVWDGKNIIDFDKMPNKAFDDYFLTDPEINQDTTKVVFERVACMGMSVGDDIFETVFWTGRMYENCLNNGYGVWRMKRHEIKMHLCQNMRAKDSNIITAIVDRFDPERVYGKYGKGKKDSRGMFYGFSKDVWQAMALGLTWWDLNR